MRRSTAAFLCCVVFCIALFVVYPTFLLMKHLLFNAALAATLPLAALNFLAGRANAQLRQPVDRAEIKPFYQDDFQDAVRGRPSGEPTEFESDSYAIFCFSGIDGSLLTVTPNLTHRADDPSDDYLAHTYNVKVQWPIPQTNPRYTARLWHTEVWSVFCSVPPEEAYQRILAQDWDGTSPLTPEPPQPLPVTRDQLEDEKTLARGIMSGTWAINGSSCAPGQQTAFFSFASDGTYVFRMQGATPSSGRFDGRFALDASNSTQGNLNLGDINPEVSSWSLNRVVLRGETQNVVLTRCGPLNEITPNKVYPGLLGASYLLDSYGYNRESTCSAFLANHYGWQSDGDNWLEDAAIGITGFTLGGFLGDMLGLSASAADCEEVPYLTNTDQDAMAQAVAESALGLDFAAACAFFQGTSYVPVGSGTRIGRYLNRVQRTGRSACAASLVDPAFTSRATKVSSQSADELNAIAVANGRQPSYRPGTTVDTYETTAPTSFVRGFYVNPDSGPTTVGQWIVPRSAIEGLSPAEIQQQLSLPQLPTGVAQVNIPVGTRIEISQVNPIFGGVDAGRIQYRIDMPGGAPLPREWFSPLPNWQFGEQ